MPAVGYINVRAYTSFAQLPLEDTAIEITLNDGTLLALRLTDRSGKINSIALPVPDKSETLSPNPPEQPFAVVNLYAYKKGFEQIEIENLQVFAGTTTIQDLEMIPLADYQDNLNDMTVINTPPQDL